MSSRDEWEQGDEPRGRPFGVRPYGVRSDVEADERPFGVRPFGVRPFGVRPIEERPFGVRPFGVRPFGVRPFGVRTPTANVRGADPDVWSADIAEFVCARSAVIRMGALLVPGEGRLPVATTDATPTFRVPGRPGPEPEQRDSGSPAELIPGDWELEAAVLVEPEIGRAITVSPEIAYAIEVDLAEALALGADGAFLGDPAGEPGPSGVKKGGAKVEAGADMLATARGVVAAVRTAGAQVRFRNPGWIFSPDTLEALTRLTTDDGLTAGARRSLDSTRLLQPDGVDGGVFLGFPFLLSAGAAPNTLYFSADWEEAWIGVHPRFVTVELSTEAPPAPPGRGVVVRASMPLDFALRRPAAFAWAGAKDT